MIWRGADNGVYLLVLKRLSEVLHDQRFSTALHVSERLDSRRRSIRIRVADVRILTVPTTQKAARWMSREMRSTPTDANGSQDNLVGRRRTSRRSSVLKNRCASCQTKGRAL
jgi:hypothetical protein